MSDLEDASQAILNNSPRVCPDPVQLYSVMLSLSMERSLFERLLQFVPDEKRVTILRYVHYEDAQRALAACLLSRIILCLRLDCSNRELHLHADSYGKPYVRGGSLHFNLSHSDKRVVLAIDRNRLGVDVERVKPAETDIAKRFFAVHEYQDLMDQPDQERDRYFYSLWTLKESYMKADGKGLSIPLDTFSFRILHSQITFETSVSESPVYRFKQYVLDDYLMAVCATHASFPNTVKDWNEKELVHQASLTLSRD